MKQNVAAQARFKTHAAIIKTLAHPTRLFILDELSRRERCVRDLTEMIGVEMPTVSRHLSLLKNAGIIDDDKRGPQVFYRVRVTCVLEVFNCAKAIEAHRRRNQPGHNTSPPQARRRLAPGANPDTQFPNKD